MSRLTTYMFWRIFKIDGDWKVYVSVFQITDFLLSQAAGQDVGHGSGPGCAHLWDGHLLPVPGHKLPGEHTHAAELFELHLAVCHLHNYAALQKR